MVAAAVCAHFGQLTDHRQQPRWRLSALAVPQPQPAGPSRLWPRAVEAVPKQPPVAPANARREDGKPSMEEVEAQLQPLGKQQVRSALEHVSNYTNNVVFPRD